MQPPRRQTGAWSVDVEPGQLTSAWSATATFDYQPPHAMIGPAPVAGLRVATIGGLEGLTGGGSEAIFYYHPDHLGTPLMLTDEAGLVVWQIESLPFGVVASLNEDVDGDGVNVVNNLRFPGQYADGETGVRQNWRRDYQPQIGRYIETDPIGLSGGINTYAYVIDNPLKFTDPLGLAYFAKRPLRGLIWLGFFSCNPIDDFLNDDFSHEQLFFEDGKKPSNIGFHEDGTLREETDPKGYRCKSGKFNDCIMRKAVQNVPLRPYCVLGKPGIIDKFNCQDWVSEVGKEYNKLQTECELNKGECCKR